MEAGKNGWRISLSNPGEDGDCPRSFFIGCDQFGRTRHRLAKVDRHQDALNMSDYSGCNTGC